MKALASEVRTSVIATFCLAVLLCGVYPLLVWVLAQVFFPVKAAGSLVTREGAVAGSRLIGQGFSGPRYFHPRPSSAGRGYDASNSGGSNLGPLSRKLVDTVQERVHRYRTENGLDDRTLIPADAVTASGSGLDPHISVQNARFQAGRVARARGLREEEVLRKIADAAEGRDLGLFGEPRVNVLLLNLALDGDR
jgi:potassium-transporting ATPase KdpC subunit